MMYLGDFAEDATVTFLFTTNAADGSRSSFSASIEQADIVIFKDGTAMTLDASTITITSEPGSRTGVHVVSVDMSNDADFTTGADYSAVLYPSDETVDSQSVAAPLAHWSCQNRYSTQQLDDLVTGQPAQKYNGVRGPGVYIDDASGVTGTTLGTHGTVDNPVDNLANALTLAASLGANRIYIQGSTTLSLAGQTLTGYEFVGLNGPDSTTVNLGTAASPSVLTRIKMFGVRVYGEHDLSDRIELMDCEIDDAPAAEVTKLHVYASNCLIVGDVTLDTSADNIFMNCVDGVAGDGYPVITATGAAGTFIHRGWRGGVGFQDLSASHKVSLDGMGKVVFESGCSPNATVNITGHWTETDNTAGMASITREASFNRAAIEAEALDALQQTVPDSIPAVGSRPNMQQAAYMNSQLLTYFSISEGTITVKKPDGTTLFTMTLDDATNPTSSTRAT